MNDLIFASDYIVIESYLNWLYDFASCSHTNKKSYKILFSDLFNTAFLAKLERDENRIRDAYVLRDIFKEQTAYADYSALDNHPISFLEIFFRLAYDIDSLMTISEDVNETGEWLWMIFDNLQLTKYDDSKWDDHMAIEVNYICQIVMNRTYCADGTYGPFPLEHPQQDQRNVELWYQMNSYLNENF